MPLSSRALTTVEAVRSALVGRDTPPPEHNAELEQIINRASEAIAHYCGKRFELHTTTVSLCGDGGPWLWLPEDPIVSVQEVLLDGAAVTDYELRESIQHPGRYLGALYRPTGWPAGRVPMRFPPYPGAQRLNVRVTYTAGWTLPHQDGRDLPYDVEAACIQLVVIAYTNRDRVGLRSESYEGLGRSFDWWPEHVKLLLAVHRMYR